MRKLKRFFIKLKTEKLLKKQAKVILRGEKNLAKNIKSLAIIAKDLNNNCAYLGLWPFSNGYGKEVWARVDLRAGVLKIDQKWGGVPPSFSYNTYCFIAKQRPLEKWAKQILEQEK